MNYALIENNTVSNIIVSDADFVQTLAGHWVAADNAAIGWRYADGQLSPPDDAPEPQPAPRHITLGALQKRMGAMRVFALDTSAHPVCVALRSYLGRLTYIDLGDPDLRPMLQMLVATQQPAANAVFPGSGPLSEGDVEAIITAPVQEGERP